MYAFVDRPVGSLSQGSRFMLWAMRSWAKARDARFCPMEALAESFLGMGAHQALQPFHRAMALINRHASSPVDVAPVGACRIGEQEAILLALWHDSLDPASRLRRNATLELLVDRDVAGIAAAFDRAAVAMELAGLAPSGITPAIMGEEL